MGRLIITLVGTTLGALVFPGILKAELLELLPAKAAVVVPDDSNTGSVVLYFDLSGMKSGAGRQIDEATLDWPIRGLSDGRRFEFEMYAVTLAWDAGTSIPGDDIETGVDAEGFWDLEPLDFARTGGTIRFDLTRLVRNWASNLQPNYGVEVRGLDWDRADLNSQLDSVKLTIRYGFTSN